MKANRNPPPRPWNGSGIWRVVLTLAAVVALVTTEYLIVPSSAQSVHGMPATGAGQPHHEATHRDVASPAASPAAATDSAIDDAEAIGRSIAAY